ncbi:MAG: hypothetical protein KKF85_15430 [Gammaproteobacteria bacterium]|nr:hypothetical protein [Rhodocyclaceae bacterium]MBU3907942.1 hypothetical protein [Gammaproteobacteria bacterium]MBU3989784.1 hypothetical protein [Gammaproteobacteria bacterium]MBU4003848.1 hypothetical protein [Gammaproteobacteria bacterium]MBU4021726.1 hypothetical protein [Gammaproteobacteria bacterium]
MKKTDTITDKELPGLRLNLMAYAENPYLSDSFRAVCLDTLAAIDLAVADDAAVNARLKLALESWKLAADVEVESGPGN